MIVLGKKYIFSEKDIQSAAMDTNDIYYVDDTAKDPQDAIQKIKNHFHLPKSEYIILNTDKEVHPTIITFLTHLQYENSVVMLSIEHFLKKASKVLYR